MTILGPDISSYQAGLNLAALTDAAFVIAKCSEGTYYTDSAYPGWHSQAAVLHKPFIWYHFLSGEDVTAQAKHNLSCVGDPHLPGMLDVEPSSTYTPTLAQTLDYADAAHAAGLNLRLVYLPKWFHQQLGSPDLSGFTKRGLQLVSSAYPGGNGSPTQLYPGDKAGGWGAYGGLTPLLYQFTAQASDGGKSLDYNAFRGSAAELVAALDPTPTPTPSTEDSMPVFATGTIEAGAGAVTMVLPPPANSGAGWGNVWFSLGSDFGKATVRVAIFTHGQGWSHIYENVIVDSAADRVNPFGGPLPTAVQKISITRLAGSENVPLSYLIEAAAR